MYPTISPDLRVEETISHPTDQAKVIGFVGRNKKLGRPAIIMKSEAISEGFDGKVVMVPTEQAELLAEENSELVVLREDTALAMDGSDFAVESHSAAVQGRGKAAEVQEVSPSSEKFRSFSRAKIEVGN